MARHLQVAWHEDEATLKERCVSEKDAQNRTRLQALWQLRQGRTIVEVAEMVGKHPRTIQDWIAWYRQGGVEEVLERRRPDILPLRGLCPARAPSNRPDGGRFRGLGGVRGERPLCQDVGNQR